MPIVVLCFLRFACFKGKVRFLIKHSILKIRFLFVALHSTLLNQTLIIFDYFLITFDNNIDILIGYFKRSKFVSFNIQICVFLNKPQYRHINNVIYFHDYFVLYIYYTMSST